MSEAAGRVGGGRVHWRNGVPGRPLSRVIRGWSRFRLPDAVAAAAAAVAVRDVYHVRREESLHSCRCFVVAARRRVRPAAEEANRRARYSPRWSSPPSTAGRTMTMSAFRGRPVLLTFWASWCGPCRVELPELSKLYGELAGRGFVLHDRQRRSEPGGRSALSRGPRAELSRSTASIPATPKPSASMPCRQIFCSTPRAGLSRPTWDTPQRWSKTFVGWCSR